MIDARNDPEAWTRLLERLEQEAACFCEGACHCDPAFDPAVVAYVAEPGSPEAVATQVSGLQRVG